MNCTISGCRNLKTTCEDCGRVVITRKLNCSSYDLWKPYPENTPNSMGVYFTTIRWNNENFVLTNKYIVSDEGNGFIWKLYNDDVTAFIDIPEAYQKQKENKS